MDEDQGDGVGVGLLLGERACALQAVLTDPYGDVAGVKGAGAVSAAAVAGRHVRTVRRCSRVRIR